MAEYIDCNIIFGKRTSGGFARLPCECGYKIVSLYGTNIPTKEIHEWNSYNLTSIWTVFDFGVPEIGKSYCFENNNDALAFKLRWL